MIRGSTSGPGACQKTNGKPVITGCPDSRTHGLLKRIGDRSPIAVADAVAVQHWSSGYVAIPRFDSSGEAVLPATEVFDHLRRSLELKLCIDDGYGECGPVQRLGVDVDPAATVMVLDGCPSADLGPNHIGGRSNDGFDDEGAGRMGDPGSNEGRGVGGWQWTWREARPSGPESREPVDAEAAPVVAVDVVGNEIPVPAERDQSVWLDTYRATVLRQARVGSLRARPRSSGAGDFVNWRGVNGSGEVRSGVNWKGRGVFSLEVSGPVWQLGGEPDATEDDAVRETA